LPRSSTILLNLIPLKGVLRFRREVLGLKKSENYTLLTDIFSRRLIGEEVKVRGWVNSWRSSGGIHFIILRDGTGFVQCTLRKGNVDDQAFEVAENVPLESVVEVGGELKEDKRAPRGIEIEVKDFKVIERAEEPYPIAKKYHGPEFLLDNRHLWIRNEKMHAILKVRAAVIDAAREWFKENGYTEVHMPTLVTAACEGGATLFELKYFDQKAYLTQSWQLYAEAVIASLGNIYTLAPSFRAEMSRTRRHLTEYWHLEAEAPWCTLDEILRVQEGLVTHICNGIAEQHEAELATLGRDPEDLLKVKSPFEKLTYDEVISTLQKEGVKAVHGEDLTYEQEKHVALKRDKPFFIMYYPKKAKAFYHKLHPEKPDLTLSADLLAPEGYGEITGGGQRVDDKEELLKRMSDEGLSQKDYAWYIDLRRFGSVPHSGFGLGVERIVAWLCKLNHIRDATAFPRLINRIYP